MSKRRKPTNTEVAHDVMGEKRRAYLLSIGGKPANRAWVAKNGKAKASRDACRKRNHDS